MINLPPYRVNINLLAHRKRRTPFGRTVFSLTELASKAATLITAAVTGLALGITIATFPIPSSIVIAFALASNRCQTPKSLSA
jgi:uncharacterized protein (DUF2062 family)